MSVEKIIELVEGMDATEADAMGVSCMHFADELIKKLKDLQVPVVRATAREEAYAAIDTERDYQDNLWGDDGNPNPLTVGEFLLLIEEYAAKARAVWINEAKPEIKTLHVVRKVAGIAVNCMEQHGAPKRSLASFDPTLLKDTKVPTL